MNRRVKIVLVSFILLTGCSTMVPTLGVKSSELTPCPDSPNCVSSQSDSEKHYIDSISYTDAKTDAHVHLLQVLKSQKRSHIVIFEEDYIRVEFTSAVFRFVDDVEFYFPDDKGEGGVIHVRSASRVGYSDFGVNRKRVEKIREQFSK